MQETFKLIAVISSQEEVSVLKAAELCWAHHQQREDSHTAERKKWLPSSRHHLGLPTWKDSWEDQTTRDHFFEAKPLAKPAFSRASQIWVSMKLGNVFQFGQFRKNNDAEPMNLGVSLFSTKPRCSTSHHGTFEFTECGPLLLLSSFSEFSGCQLLPLPSEGRTFFIILAFQHLVSVAAGRFEFV